MGKQFQRSLCVESLESKRLLAADLLATYDELTNTLTVRGNQTDNRVLLSRGPEGEILIEPTEGSELKEGSISSAPGDADILIQMGGGNDFVDIRLPEVSVPEADSLVALINRIDIRTGPGEDSVELNEANASSISIITGTEKDTVVIGEFPIDPSDVLPPTVVAETFEVKTGAGDDLVIPHSLAAQTVDFLTGLDNDLVLSNAGSYVSAEVMRVYTSRGEDTVQIQRSNPENFAVDSMDIRLGADNDGVTLLNTNVLDLEIRAAAGEDFVGVYDTALDSLFVAGGGDNDQIYVQDLVDSLINIRPGMGDDFVNLEGTVDPASELRGAAGEDVLHYEMLPDTVVSFESQYALGVPEVFTLDFAVPGSDNNEGALWSGESGETFVGEAEWGIAATFIVLEDEATTTETFEMGEINGSPTFGIDSVDPNDEPGLIEPGEFFIFGGGTDYNFVEVVLETIEFSELDPGDTGAIVLVGFDDVEVTLVEINSDNLVYSLLDPPINFATGTLKLVSTSGDGFSLSSMTISATLVQ